MTTNNIGIIEFFQPTTNVDKVCVVIMKDASFFHMMAPELLPLFSAFSIKKAEFENDVLFGFKQRLYYFQRHV